MDGLGRQRPDVLVVGNDPVERGPLRRASRPRASPPWGARGTRGTDRDLTVRLGPDVVLIDRHLLDAEGLEQARGLREARPCIEVVILTAYDGPPTESAEAVGAHAYL